MERFQGNINSKQFTILLLVFIHSFADARYYSFRTVLDLWTRTVNCFIAGICVKYEFNVWQGISKYRRFCRFLFQYLECRLAFISPLEGFRLFKKFMKWSGNLSKALYKASAVKTKSSETSWYFYSCGNWPVGYGTDLLGRPSTHATASLKGHFPLSAQMFMVNWLNQRALQ